MRTFLSCTFLTLMFVPSLLLYCNLQTRAVARRSLRSQAEQLPNAHHQQVRTGHFLYMHLLAIKYQFGNIFHCLLVWLFVKRAQRWLTSQPPLFPLSFADTDKTSLAIGSTLFDRALCSTCDLARRLPRLFIPPPFLSFFLSYLAKYSFIHCIPTPLISTCILSFFLLRQHNVTIMTSMLYCAVLYRTTGASLSSCISTWVDFPQHRASHLSVLKAKCRNRKLMTVRSCDVMNAHLSYNVEERRDT